MVGLSDLIIKYNGQILYKISFCNYHDILIISDCWYFNKQTRNDGEFKYGDYGFMRLLKWLRSNHCNLQIMSLKIWAYKITLLTLIMNQTSKFWFIWKLIGLKGEQKISFLNRCLTWTLEYEHYWMDLHLYCTLIVLSTEYTNNCSGVGWRERSAMAVLVIITVCMGTSPVAQPSPGQPRQIEN